MHTALRLLALLYFFPLVLPLCAQTATQVWAERYNGPEDGDDLATGVAVDREGNVVVTGQSRNATNPDFYTRKYAADGALFWEKRYNGPANRDDFAYGVAVDGAGNVAVTGSSNNAGGNSDIYTAKYAAADGALLWEKRYNGPANLDDNAYSVAVDSAGNVAVTGSSQDANGSSDYYTAKYAAADGALLWEKRYVGPGDSYDFALSLAVDATGNVAVSGISANAAGNADYYTAKYAAANGALLWEKRFDGSTNGDDYAYSVAMDVAGNVAVTGTSYKAGGDPDCYTAKYAAANGALLWEKRYDAAVGSYDFAYSVAMDTAGNVAVTGYSAAETNSDYYTAKYAAADGALLWEKRYSGPAGNNLAFSAAMDEAGNVVVSGNSSGGSNYDYYTAKYSAADGSLLWEQRYNGPADLGDVMDSVFPYPGKLALTLSGGAVVTGQSLNASNWDYATVRYSPPAGDVDGDGLQDWWEKMWWGTTAGITALDDFDRDGIPELLELGFGLNPMKPDALPPVVNEGGYLTITITKQAGVTYQVETAAAPNAPAFSPATTFVQVNNDTTLKVRDIVPIGTPPARYLRVKVIAAQ